MGFVRLPQRLIEGRDPLLGQLERIARQAPLYGLIDLAAASDAGHWHARLVKTRAARSLFEGQPESSAAQQAPWVLQPRTDDGAISLRRTVDEALACGSVCWIASELPLDELARRLSRRLTALLPDGSAALFRYYDSRLFSSWWKRLPDEAKRDFGAFGTRWLALDPRGELYSEALSGVPERDPLQPPWKVTSEQQATLAETSERWQILDFLSRRHPELHRSMSRGDLWDFVARHDVGARSRHVQRFADRLKYCELAVQHGERFADEPRWINVWNAMAATGCRLAEAVPTDATADLATGGMHVA